MRRERAVLVTGAAGGIGQALGRVFRDAGFRTIGWDLREPAGYDAFVAADLASLVLDPPRLAESIAAVRAGLGEAELAALVNNAAVQRVGSVEALRVDDWTETLHVNLVAPFLLVQALLPELRRARGAVVNVGSVHARHTKPGFACYAASKAGLAGLTRALAVELGGSVRVNAVQPAATDTPMLRAGFEGREMALARVAAMHPLGRIAEPEEVARAVLYLASEAASFANGAVLDVDGGIGARLHDPE